MDQLITYGGLVYGAILIIGTLLPSPITDVFRLDAMLVPQPTPQTRIINLLAGLAFAGYSFYSLY